jgi:SsrA-binding protein
MAKKSKSNQQDSNTIIINRKAKFEYHILDKYEAGIALEGWEVKSIRAGKIQLVDSHVIMKNHEAFLLGALITPLISTCTHIKPDDRRTRKLLLHRSELATLIGKIKEKGLTVVPLAMYWKKNRIKVEVALVKGKKIHDKRETIKERDLQRESRKYSL